jgi:toxin CcdB
MAQFDVFKLPDGEWVVAVQSDMLDVADTVVVVPLVAPDHDATAADRLNPLLEVAGERRLLATQLIGAVNRRALSRSIGSLIADEYVIKTALDLLISGI